ncbi:hypothetical protein [Brevibacterium atlanticum]|uniref:hypothetical protein n=1 Tax=Brevibacterium atlanticum TaxID=2697563 RepID=UPI001420E65F|nr:hypothetical protein [Brevibacterium atlanticum]
MKRTVIVSGIVVALLGFGASPSFADAAPTTTTEAAPSIPEGPSAVANGTEESPAPVPDHLSGPSSNGAAEAGLPPDSTTPIELRPDHGSTGQGPSNTGSSNNGSSSGAEPGTGTGGSTDSSGSGHTSGSSTRANAGRATIGRSASERGATSASASSVSTDAPHDGTSAGEASASSGANGTGGANNSAGVEGSTATDNANGRNSSDTNGADDTASGDGADGTSATDTADAGKDGSSDVDADSDAPAQIDASVTVSPDEITESDLYFEGITVTVSGLEPGDRVTNSLDDEARAVRSSAVEFTYLPEDFVEAGVVDFTITVSREGVADQAIQSEFTVVSDSDAVEGTLTMSATRMTVSDFADKGIDFTAEPFAQGEPILGLAFSDDSEDALYFDDDLTADSSGRVSGTLTVNSDAEPAPGDYHFFVISDDAEAWADFTLTEDVVPTEPTSSGTESTGSKDTALPHAQNESTSREATSTRWSRAGSAWPESDDASESASLPRTGAELGSLGLGGALLIAGVAMVAITAHRRSESK